MYVISREKIFAGNVYKFSLTHNLYIILNIFILFVQIMKLVPAGLNMLSLGLLLSYWKSLFRSI